MNNENMLPLEFPDEQKSIGPVECLGMTFENDEKRREYFLEKLREKLKVFEKLITDDYREYLRGKMI